MRVLSLIASSTEMVYALKAEGFLVGRSHECDYPSAVKNLPQVTKPAFNTELSSRKIDEQVKSHLKDALSIYQVDRELLKELKPDVILTQTQCEVCAVSLKDVQNALTGDLGFTPKLVSLNPNALKDIWEDFKQVSIALGLDAYGQEIIFNLQNRMSEIQKKSSVLANKPTVALIEWIDPLMAAGNWMPELIEMAGGVSLFGEAGKHSPWMKLEELVSKNPDVIIVSPCGFDMSRTLQEFHLLKDNSDFKKLKAYKTKKIFIADGNQYFNRPGPRVAESLEIMAEILHPQVFHFDRYPKGWIEAPLQ